MTIKCGVSSNTVSNQETGQKSCNGDSSNGDSFGGLRIWNHKVFGLPETIELTIDQSKSGGPHYKSAGLGKTTLYFDKAYKLWILGENYDIQKAGCYAADIIEATCPIGNEFICRLNGEWKTNYDFTFL